MGTKVTIQLPDGLYHKTQRYARLHRQGMDEAISTLIEQGLASGDENIERIEGAESDPAVEREMHAYMAMHPILKQEYMGEHVAIFHGKLVDHDLDFAALFERIEQTYADDFVWLAKVEDEPLPTIYHRPVRLIRDE
jgi:hypothetical protein